MWIIFALLAPFLFAIVHMMDSYCVDTIFEKPWIGIFTSSAASIIFFIPLPFIAPFIVWDPISIYTFAIAFLCGCLLQVSQGLYFQALSYSHADIIGSYWNLIPIFVPILSYILYKDLLSLIEYLGITLLVGSSTFMLLLDHNISFRKKSFLLMVGAAFIQAIIYILLDSLYLKDNYFEIFCITTLGIICFGLTTLIPKHTRKYVIRNMQKTSFTFKFFIVIEIINLIALACAQKAIQLGNPSLVTAIETVIPFFVLLNTGLLLILGFRKYAQPEIVYKNFTNKIIALVLMTAGVWAVS